jgi:glycosyltransferase involved in cell wall biosynthesis
VRHGYFERVPSFVIYNIAESTAARSVATKVRDANLLVFGFIGNVRPDKGIDVVLEACGKLANPNWRLRIAGAGLNSYVEDLKQRFTDSRIEWLGFVDSMQFYESIDVSVISSVWAEPLPRTLIETFAAGKSAICARSGGIPEIASLGKIVEMYPAKDVEALARIMDDALTNVKLWKQGGFKDSSALDVFSEASITSQYRAVYQGDIDAL